MNLQNHIKYLILLPFLIASCTVKDQPQDISIIAFGSCNRSNLEQPLWQPILENNPDLWIWLGDNVYADTEDMNKMKATYQEQLDNSGYGSLLENTSVIGTWDDHDYGANNAGRNYVMKRKSKKLLLDFLKVPDSAEVRTRPGVFQSFTFGDNPKQLKVLLLDTRYFRDDPKQVDGTYIPNVDGTILGKSQWNWLENEIATSKADIHLIGSSIQVISEEHEHEKWANFPNERKRLLELLSNIACPVILSGDRHIGEISSMQVNDQTIYEITSSGLTHPWTTFTEEPNQYRNGHVVSVLHFGLLTADWKKRLVTVQLKGSENNGLEKIQISMD